MRARLGANLPETRRNCAIWGHFGHTAKKLCRSRKISVLNRNQRLVCSVLHYVDSELVAIGSRVANKSSYQRMWLVWQTEPIEVLPRYREMIRCYERKLLTQFERNVSLLSGNFPPPPPSIAAYKDKQIVLRHGKNRLVDIEAVVRLTGMRPMQPEH